ncbi:unnamed protein product [Calypogeia fissa]
MPDCPVVEGGGECLEWVHKYLMDCVCNRRDEMSLALGLMSVFSWGVAEVPQIITNFKEQNTEGVSLAFLMTWVLGDVFNLAGCYLEPATLPTQFYMAFLYTVTTLILVGQTIYYNSLNSRKFHLESPESSVIKGETAAAPQEQGGGAGVGGSEYTQKPAKLDIEAQRQHSRPAKRSDSSSPQLSSSINVPHGHHRRSSRDQMYYTSARSLASSHTPIVGSYLAGSRESGSHTQSFLRHSSTQGSIVAQDAPGNVPGSDVAIPRRGSDSPHDDSSASSANSAGRGGSGVLGRSATAVAASVLLMGTVGLSSTFGFGRGGGRGLQRVGRSLLLNGSGAQKFVPHYFRARFGEAEANGPWGEILGWFMATIYMGGRLPQIMLNIRRGTVEGLNPLMFVFALVGNVTYVSSILVRTLDWTLIKPNMPWLVDAGVCVCLDCFIIGQFLYYECRAGQVDGRGSDQLEEDKKGNYELVR